MDDLKRIFELNNEEKSPLVISGPCSAESQAQVMEIAEALCSIGIRYFRAGIWKPRTKPGGFEGVGSRGLSWLKEIKRKLDLTPVIEIATPVHLELALQNGINNFWIGARTTTNPFAVQAIADRLKSLDKGLKDRLTILIKNPVNPDLELWIGAIQRIYKSGLRRIGAIHRGFSSYGEHYYRNRPEWSIPLELKHRMPELPLICDPSHIAGRRDLILPLSQEALDLDFDGLMIETHCHPDKALSDGGQQITVSQLKDLLEKLITKREGSDNDALLVFRQEIDRIDNQLMSLLAQRMNVSKSIGEYKRKNNLPVWQSERYKELMSRHLEDTVNNGLSDEFVKKILSAIHEESVRLQLSSDKKTE